MATIVLTAVGTIIGGPIGGAIGAAAGQAIDAELFKPATRTGPRLSDLAIQTASYGSTIPRLYGRVRVAGTVIWSTDLIEQRGHQGGGKGQPGVDTFSYSASFAVALSGRPIRGVGRIWADGALLRGAAGDLKESGTLRIHTGAPDQAPDPLIASIEGADATPAYRGMAYAVFDGLALARFGNRLPMLSFEVFADDGVVTPGAILTDCAAGVVRATTPVPVLEGLAVTDDRLRDLAEQMATVADVRLRDDGQALVDATDDGVPIDDDPVVPVESERRAATGVPVTVSIGYHDIARDYQPGTQSAVRPGPDGPVRRIAWPASMAADTAQALAATLLARDWQARRVMRVTLPWRAIGMQPGMIARVNGDDWHVESVTVERMAVSLTLTPRISPHVATGAADPGRSLQPPDKAVAPTRLALIDLPGDGDVAATQPVIAIAADTIRPVPILASHDGVAWEAAGVSGRGALFATLVSPLATGPVAIADRRAPLDVVLADKAATLADADAARMAAGANLLVVGEELIQFARAIPLGDGAWRLFDLWRGRGDGRVGAHPAGASAIIIDRLALAFAAPAYAHPGAAFLPAGSADADAVPVTLAAAGRTLIPLPPVHVRTSRVGADITLRWVRSSRAGGAWRDGVDVPLGEEVERYRVTVTPDLGAPRTAAIDAPGWTYDPAPDRAAGATSVRFDIAQIGTHAVGAPATITLSL